MKLKYVVCAKCGHEDRPRKPLFKNGHIISAHNVGTATNMRCNDCGGNNYSKHALRCRDCCPTGHGTRFDESNFQTKSEFRRMNIEKYGPDEGR